MPVHPRRPVGLIVSGEPTPAEIVRHHDDTPPPGQTPWVGKYRPATEIRVVDPDPAWPATYAALRERIVDALGPRALRVEHVGSTSVPDLPAKPVIDIDLVVASSADEPAWLPDLEAAGFVLTVREPWWQEHRCLVLDEPRCNLHVFSPDATEPVRTRIFRDWLREHADDRDRYRDAKLAAARDANAAGEHVMDYNARKEPVIHAIYDRAFRALGLLPD